MKIIAAFQKDKGISYTSHLDVQRTLQRAFRRANLPLAYSKGFNPHPKLSFATALATGFSSEAEWIEVELEHEISAEDFVERANGALPNGIRFVSSFIARDKIDTLSKLLNCARYRISLHPNEPLDQKSVQTALTEMMRDAEIIVSKKTKSGVKPVNIRPEILEAFVENDSEDAIQIELLGTLTVLGGLRVETFVNALYARLGVSGFASVHRIALYFSGSDQLPRLS